MPSQTPPTLDPAAAQRWRRRALPESAWLHEEVARRMHQRLDVIRLQPAGWVHWHALHGGRQAQADLQQRYPRAECWVVEEGAALQTPRLREQGPLTLLCARTPGGRWLRLAWWPDTLDAAGRRQLRLAVAATSRNDPILPAVAA